MVSIKTKPAIDFDFNLTGDRFGVHDTQSDQALAIDTTAVTYAAYVSAKNKGRDVGIPLL
jgi:hypothetical protein